MKKGTWNSQGNIWMVILAVFSTAAFFAYHIMLDQHYRLNSDEFACLSYAKDGIPGIGYAWRFYMHREGNFLCMALQGLCMLALAKGLPPWIFLLFIKASLWLAILWFYKSVFNVLKAPILDHLNVLATTATIITLYLISSNRPEIWHWAMGTVAYVPPVIFVLLAATLLVRNQLLLAFIPMAFIMQSRATYAVLFYGAITLLFAYRYYTTRQGGSKYLLINIGLLILLLAYMFAPGNSNRLPEDQFGIFFLLNQFKRDLITVFISFNLAKLDRVAIGLLAIVPFLPKINVRIARNLLVLPALLYGLFVIGHAALFVVATGYSAWTRVYSMHTFLFLAALIFYGHYFFGGFRPYGAFRKAAGPVGISLLFIALFWNFRTDLGKAQEFSRAYDAEWKSIFAYKGSGSDTLYLKPLPDPEVLCYFEFDENPGHWINSDFKEAYGLEFHVALDKGNNEK